MTTPILSNYLRQNAAGLFDAAITIAILVLLAQIEIPSFFNFLVINSNGTLTVVVSFVLYRLVSITLFNRTLGMKLLNIEFLTQDFKKPSFFRRILASLFILTNGVRYYTVG